VSPSRPATATSHESAASSFGLRNRDLRGGEAQKTLTAVPVSTAVPHEDVELRRDWRLHKHADYQRVYHASRKQWSSLLTYFAAPRPIECAGSGPRVGITAGKVLGKAVERNRIKRRMRAAITANLDALCSDVDVVLHPKRAVLTAEWNDLQNEVRRVFVKIAEGIGRNALERKP
jgi:ribonuclease P protein component